jgi:3-deoxy-D-manno-octulosonate 8-phosphate phosphatase (KDO 8-P phosphatase)
LNQFKLDLIVYDFDGVMTDNKVYVDQNGHEMVQVNRADGLAVAEIKKLGIEQIIISTEENLVVSVRADKLGIPYLQGIDNKKKALIDYCEKNDFDLKYVAYIGNDINDKIAMETAGVSFCPADAHENIKAISDYILKIKGGEGVVRELFDLISVIGYNHI